MIQGFKQKLFSYLPGVWVFRSAYEPTGCPGCPGPLGGGGTCRLQAITGGTASIQPITGGEVTIHES